MTRRRALLIGCAALGACRRGEPSRIRLVTYQGSETPHVARGLGLFEKHGLSVSVEEVPGASKVMESLLGGSADVILGTYDQALQVGAQGRLVRSFLLISECHCLGLVVSPRASRPVRTIADLKGATVGVSAPGGPMQNFLNFLLARNSIPRDEVGVAAFGIGPSSLAALEHGKVDAGVVFYGTMLELQRRSPELTVLAETFSRAGTRRIFGQETFPSTSLLARAPWLERNPESARRLVRAFRETVAWMRTAPLDEIRAKLPEASRNPDPAIDRATLQLLIPMFSPTGRMTVEAARLSLEVLAVSRPEIRQSPLRLEDTFTNEFLAES